MFGYLQGARHDRVYRQLYACCCSSLRDRFGYRALPFVSYEAIFAKAVAVDLGLNPAPAEDTPSCCKTRRKYSTFRASTTPSEIAVEQFTTSLAMLLAETKLRDDENDSRSVLAKLMRIILKKRVVSSLEFFETHIPEFAVRLQTLLDQHADLERPGKSIELRRYARPTGEAFALVFGALPAAVFRAEGRKEGREFVSHFHCIGRLVGESLIAFDCAADFHQDRKRGHYNPLPSPTSVGNAYEFAQRKLVELGWSLSRSENSNGTESTIATSILSHRLRTIASRKRAALRSRTEIGTARNRKSFIPRLSPPQPRRGICDCDCFCEGCDGCGTVFANLGDCCLAPTHCCTACCEDCCGTACPPDSKKDQIAKPPNAERTGKIGRVDLVSPGQKGEVVVALSPYGTIRLLEGDDSELAAKSDMGVIRSGEPVVVVRKESFGLLVRRPKKTGDREPEPSDT